MSGKGIMNTYIYKGEMFRFHCQWTNETDRSVLEHHILWRNGDVTNIVFRQNNLVTGRRTYGNDIPGLTF